MIEVMKKVTVVCLESDRAKTVEALQDQGLVHVTNVVQPASKSLDDLLKQQEKLRKMLKEADDRLPKSDGHQEKNAKIDPVFSLDDAVKLLDAIKSLEDENVAIAKKLELLEPWGTFDFNDIQKFKDRGIHIALCITGVGNTKLRQLPENAFIKEISQNQGVMAFAVISTEPLDDIQLPRATIPEVTDQFELKRKLKQNKAQLDQCNADFISLAENAKEAWNNYKVTLEDDIQLERAKIGMGNEGELAYLIGYVPEPKLDDVRNEAYRQGWAIRYEDIEEDDHEVPTLLNIPKRFKIAQHIFDFIGILPGYFETDVSIAMLIFLSLFCGMLVGDAGYGALLTIASLVGLKKATTEKAREISQLSLLISLCILGYGWLSGNWFGLPNQHLPKILKGIPWLYDDVNQINIKLLCFFIGAFHTSLARAWQAYNVQQSKRQAAGHIGWGLFLWGNFFLAKVLICDGKSFGDLPLEGISLYIVGFTLILTCGIDWKSMEDLIYTPFSFVNSFVDVLSYIRLYAVGLSGVYIAQTFNDMAKGIYESSPFLIPVVILILLAGHLLNITMAAMSILVHAIRLNTLEFSGHIDVSWCGKPYKPLKKTQLD